MHCCVCQNPGPLEIHHIIPQEENGADDIDNAAPLCPTCHGIYGANPKKRKFVRECRDNWNQLCERRFKWYPNAQGQEKHDYATKSDIDSILKFLAKQNYPTLPQYKNGDPYSSLSEILKWLFSFDITLFGVPLEQRDWLYHVFFSSGTSEPEEFTAVKEVFLSFYGSEIARRLCGITLVNWSLLHDCTLEGFTDGEFDVLENTFLILMMMFNMHEEIDVEPPHIRFLIGETDLHSYMSDPGPIDVN